MKNQNQKFDLSFGNSVCVREAFAETVGCGYQFMYADVMAMDYPVHNGDPDLVQITRNIIRRQIGLHYKHVFITNGATGGVTIALRAYRKQGYVGCHFREAPYYSRYPGMVDASGLAIDNREDRWKSDFTVNLIDLPSNPRGSFDDERGFLRGPIILDAVYFNKVYCKVLPEPIAHDVLVGSYSKLLGINSIRMGWIATNDDLLADRIGKLITAEYCGLSGPSATLLKCYLQPFNWENFENKANIKLDFNREEFAKLEKFFGNEPIPANGMFYYAPMDKECQRLMEKAGIIWTKGSLMGTDDDFGRFNIGQDIRLIKEAVRTVLKIDKA